MCFRNPKPFLILLGVFRTQDFYQCAIILVQSFSQFVSKAHRQRDPYLLWPAWSVSILLRLRLLTRDGRHWNAAAVEKPRAMSLASQSCGPGRAAVCHGPKAQKGTACSFAEALGDFCSSFLSRCIDLLWFVPFLGWILKNSENLWNGMDQLWNGQVLETLAPWAPAFVLGEHWEHLGPGVAPSDDETLGRFHEGVGRDGGAQLKMPKEAPKKSLKYPQMVMIFSDSTIHFWKAFRNFRRDSQSQVSSCQPWRDLHLQSVL